MTDDTVQFPDDGVQQNPCPPASSTIAVDAGGCRPSIIEEPALSPMCSTIVVLSCTSQPLVLGMENRSPPMSQFSDREVMDAAIASLTAWQMPGIATASVRLFGPQRQVRRVWTTAVRFVYAVGRSMRRAATPRSAKTPPITASDHSASGLGCAIGDVSSLAERPGSTAGIRDAQPARWT